MTLEVLPGESLPLEAILSRDVLSRHVGDRLPTVTEYQRRLNVGSGTFQRALANLKARGALTVRSRGHKGTFITSMDLPSLWNAALLGPLHLVMSPSTGVEARALLGGLSEHLERVAGAALTIGFQPGATSRLKILENQEADLITMSSGALDAVRSLAGSDRSGLAVTEHLAILTLGSGSYYSPDSIVVVSKDPNRATWRRIGIDLASIDHRILSEAEFGDTYEVVNTDFPTLPLAVLDGSIDAGIWHVTDTLFSPQRVGLSTTPLSAHCVETAFERVSSATIVASLDTAAGSVLLALDSEALARRVAGQENIADLPPYLVERPYH